MADEEISPERLAAFMASARASSSRSQAAAEADHAKHRARVDEGLDLTAATREHEAAVQDGSLTEGAEAPPPPAPVAVAAAAAPASGGAVGSAAPQQ